MEERGERGRRGGCVNSREGEGGGGGTYVHCTVNKVNDFPVPSQDVTNQTLPDRE
jgi:hypothetical protein